MNHPLRPFREAYASQNQRPKPAVAAVAYRYCNCGPVPYWASTQQLSAAKTVRHTLTIPSRTHAPAANTPASQLAAAPRQRPAMPFEI
jgi:hypothetical protein